MSKRPMLVIPISAAKKIAEQYGYDQVVIIARRVGQAPDPYGEHVTTYGVDREHCRSAALQGDALKKFMGWPAQELKHGPDCECGCRTDALLEAKRRADVEIKKLRSSDGPSFLERHGKT